MTTAADPKDQQRAAYVAALARFKQAVAAGHMAAVRTQAASLITAPDITLIWAYALKHGASGAIAFGNLWSRPGDGWENSVPTRALVLNSDTLRASEDRGLGVGITAFLRHWSDRLLSETNKRFHFEGGWTKKTGGYLKRKYTYRQRSGSAITVETYGWVWQYKLAEYQRQDKWLEVEQLEATKFLAAVDSQCPAWRSDADGVTGGLGARDSQTPHTRGRPSAEVQGIFANKVQRVAAGQLYDASKYTPGVKEVGGGSMPIGAGASGGLNLTLIGGVVLAAAAALLILTD